MAQKVRGEISADLARACERFRVWRETRTAGTRIPHPLWDLAAELAAVHGVSRTATLLRLDYYALKRRVDAQRNRPQAADAAFIEVPPTSLSLTSECTVEFEDGWGASIRVHLKGCEVPDVLALGNSFWKGP